MSSYGIYVGGIDGESVECLGELVLGILNSSADDRCKEAALELVKSKLQSPHHLSFNNVSVSQLTPCAPQCPDAPEQTQDEGTLEEEGE